MKGSPQDWTSSRHNTEEETARWTEPDVPIQEAEEEDKRAPPNMYLNNAISKTTGTQDHAPDASE